MACAVRRGRVRLACWAAAMAVLAAAGCSSGSAGTAGGSTGSGGSSAASGGAAAGQPILIGTIGSYSGPVASSISATKLVMQAWVAWTNAHGGLAGHQVRLDVVDDADNATQALSGARQLLQDHVVAIVGEESEFDSVWAGVAAAAGVPVIGADSIGSPFLTNPDFFPATANSIAVLYGVVAIAKQIGPEFADLYCAEAPVCATGPGVYRVSEAALGGIKDVYDSSISASAPDYTAVCQAVKNSGAQSYTISHASSVVVAVAARCLQQGVTAKLISADGTVTPAFLTGAGTRNFIGVSGAFPFYDTTLPAARDFHAAVDQYEPSVQNSLGPTSSSTWVSAQLFAAAVKAAGPGPVTSASVKHGLYSLKNETLGGLSQPLNFTPGKPARNNCYFTIGATNGVFTEPHGLKTTCAPAALVNTIAATYK